MQTENWLQIITTLAGIVGILAGFILKYAVRIASNTATITVELEGFKDHVEHCDDDRKELWKSIHDLELKHAADH